MKPSFLCVNHRQQLQANPQQALKAWAKSYEAGQTFIASGLEVDALAHLGCAFETSELILSQKFADFYDCILMVTASTATFAKTLKQLSHYAESEKMVDLAVDRLHKEILTEPEHAAFIQNQIVTLRYFLADPQVTDFPSIADHFHWFDATASGLVSNATVH